MVKTFSGDPVASSKTWAERQGIEMPKKFYTDPERWTLLTEKEFNKRVDGGFWK